MGRHHLAFAKDTDTGRNRPDRRQSNRRRDASVIIVLIWFGFVLVTMDWFTGSRISKMTFSETFSIMAVLGCLLLFGTWNFVSDALKYIAYFIGVAALAVAVVILGLRFIETKAENEGIDRYMAERDASRDKPTISPSKPPKKS
jgi:hypothetical protein